MNLQMITQNLRSFPTDLDATHELILTRINQAGPTESLRDLRWVDLATRPLFIEEIMDAWVIENPSMRQRNQ
jgi:hypothetical protein